MENSVVMRKPAEILDADHELVIERVCAIDVAKASGMLCTRLPQGAAAGRRVSRVWEVAATTRAITELADHLVAVGIEQVTVESTSDYWRIWFYLLEARGLDVQLVNARDVKNLPGRPKTDKLDAVWLAKLTEKGLLRPSFVPPMEIRQLRDYTRLRVDLTRERTRHWQRLEKLLEDALIKVSSVASKLDTRSVRDMLEALIAGDRDPRRLAELARGRMKTKRGALVEALSGRFDEHHAEIARILLDQIDGLSAAIDQLTTRAELLLQTLLAAQPGAQPAGGAVHAPGSGDLRPAPHRGPHRGHHRGVCPGRRHPGPSWRQRAVRRTTPRRDRRYRPVGGAGHHRRNRARHESFPHSGASGVLGQTLPPHHSVRCHPPWRDRR
jgi:transposase